MHRMGALKIAFVLLLGVAGAANARAKDDLLGMLPDETLGFVVITNPAELSGEIQALGEELGQEVPDPLALLTDELPALDAVDLSRPVVGALLPDVNSKLPKLNGLLMLPVNDFEAFVKSCGATDLSDDVVQITLGDEEMVAAERNGYALLIDSSDRHYFGLVAENEGETAAAMAPFLGRIGKADIYGGVTRAGIAMAIGKVRSEIHNAQAMFEQADGGPELQGMPGDFIAEAMGIYDILFDALDENVQCAGFSADLVPRGIKMREIWTLTDSDLSRRLGEIEPLSIDWMERLPSGNLFIAGGGPTPAALSEEMLGFSTEMMSALPSMYGMDEEEAATLMEEMAPLMEQYEGMAFCMAVPRNPDAPLYAATGGVIFLKGGAEAFLDEYAAVTAQMFAGGSGPMDISEPERIEIDGRPAMKVDFKFDMFSGAEAAPELGLDPGAMMEQMYGPGGKLTVYMAAADDKTIAFAYVSQGALKRMMAMAVGGSDLPSLADRVGLQRLVKMLPAEAQWVGILDLRGYRALICKILGPMGEFMFPEVKTAPIGMAVTADTGEVCFDIVVPFQTISNISEAAQNFQQNMEQMMGPGMEGPPRLPPAEEEDIFGL